MTVSICVFIFVCRFIYLFTFKDPLQESSFLKEVGLKKRKKKKDRAVTEGWEEGISPSCHEHVS